LNIWVAIGGVAGIVVTVLAVGAYLYDKNPMLSGIIIAIGLVIAISVIIAEVYLRNKELEARIHGYLPS
jgi:uncharacterized membrane protein